MSSFLRVHLFGVVLLLKSKLHNVQVMIDKLAVSKMHSSVLHLFSLNSISPGLWAIKGTYWQFLCVSEVVKHDVVRLVTIKPVLL